MKTFLILFAIAVSLPSEAQRVRENVKQRVAIIENNDRMADKDRPEAQVEVSRGKGKEKVEKALDALRKR